MQEWRSIGSEALGKRSLCQKQKCTCGECKIAWKESNDHHVEEISIERLVIWQYPLCNTWSYIGPSILSSSLLPLCCRDHVSWWVLVPLVFLVTSVRTKYRILDHFCHKQYWHIFSRSITLSFDIGIQTARKLNDNVSSEKPMANTLQSIFIIVSASPHQLNYNFLGLNQKQFLFLVFYSPQINLILDCIFTSNLSYYSMAVDLLFSPLCLGLDGVVSSCMFESANPSIHVLIIDFLKLASDTWDWEELDHSNIFGWY